MCLMQMGKTEKRRNRELGAFEKEGEEKQGWGGTT